MKKKIIIGIIIGIIIISLSCILGILLIPKNKEIRHNQNEDIMNVNSNKELENQLFTNYEDFSNVIENSNVSEEDFKNYNYYLFSISYDSCSESNITPTNYKIGKDKIIITVEYESSCGVCPKEYLYYVLKLKKDIPEKEIQLDYKVVKKEQCDPNVDYKPIIYLYPEEETEIEVKFLKEENLLLSYPEYKNSWKVLADKDGILKIGDREYYGLYWEGKNHKMKQQEDGFVVEKENIISFLEEKLKILGLNDKELDEFIIYWLPILEKNQYNYIRFETMEEINNYMPISITPEPDNIIRILMDYKPLQEKIEVKEQELVSPIRNGFTVVEWGGSLI